MLLRRRSPRLEDQPTVTRAGYEHLPPGAVAVLSWLTASHVEFVLIGPVAESIRTGGTVGGPVAIVPAPYGRNLERLTRALWAEHARTRVEPPAGSLPARIDPHRLMRGQLLTMRCGQHDIDVEARPEAVSRYQEILYEAHPHEIVNGVRVQVAGFEDLERYAQLRRGRTSPEIRISRKVQTPPEPSLG